MMIVVTGGRYRNRLQLVALAVAYGHELVVHEGKVHGGGADELRRWIERADLCVVVTDVNSHGAMHIAKQAARRAARPVLILRRLGISRLRMLLESLDRSGQEGTTVMVPLFRTHNHLRR